MIDTLEKNAFRYVESLLYSYPYLEREIKRLRLEILYPYEERAEEVNEKGKNSVRQPGDPTANKAIKLATHSKLVHMERSLDAIKQVYDKLPDPKRELIRVKYWTQPQRLTTVGICEEVGISERTYHRWRKEIIQDIAEILGLA